jgi:hypothetical protein
LHTNLPLEQWSIPLLLLEQGVFEAWLSNGSKNKDKAMA